MRILDSKSPVTVIECWDRVVSKVFGEMCLILTYPRVSIELIFALAEEVEFHKFVPKFSVCELIVDSEEN